MDNKLSDLSKPVAWFTDDYLTDKSATTYSEEMAQRWRDKPWFVGNLYSQEYVSALLAELEAKEGKIVELRNRGINAVTAEERTSTEWQKRAEKAEAFRDQMVRYVVRLGTSVIDPTVVETILTAAERSKCVGDEQ